MEKSDSSKKRKKMKKSFHYGKRQKSEFGIGPEMKGFLVTCNLHEREAIREAYSLLDRFSSKVKEEDGEADGGHDAALAEDDDIEAHLQSETATLQKEASKSAGKKNFQLVKTSVKNLLFIRTCLPDPCKTVMSLMDEIDQTGVQLVRYLLRIIPVDETCKAYVKNLTSTMERVLRPYFENKPDQADYSFVVDFKARCNDGTISKATVVSVVVDLLKAMGSKAVVNYKNPDLTVMVQVVKDVACCSVLPKYLYFKKYNPGEFSLFKRSQMSQSTEDPVVDQAAATPDS